MSVDEPAGQVAVVTGAAHGVGRAIAVRLAATGHSLALVDSDEVALAHTAELCEAQKATCDHWVRDVTDAASVDSFVADVGDRLGVPSALYNAAGVMHVGTTAGSTVEDMRRVIDTNLLGTVITTQALLPALRSHCGSRVVTISSAFGLVGVGGYSAYAASKFGVRGFSAALRQEIGYGPCPVKVSCAVLGGIRTDIMRRATYAPGVSGPDVQARFDRSVARTTADRAAQLVILGADRGRAEFTVGWDAWVTQLLTHLPDRLVNGLVRRVLPSKQG